MCRYRIVAVWVLVASRKCMSARLVQNGRITDPNVEFPAVDQEENLCPLKRYLSKISAEGNSEGEYIAKWNEALQDMYGKMDSISSTGPSLAEIGVSTGAWVKTDATDFVPRSWRSMLAMHGHRCGEGSFGRVYVIETAMSMDASKDIPLAIKVEKKIGNIKSDEINLGKRFNHPYLVKVWDSGTVQKHKAMLMESAPGGDLEKGYKLRPKEIAKAMLEMFVVMDYIHGEGYVHSDFKPEQILRSASGVAKLGDLGFTCQNGSSGFAGSPIFMSPELVRFGIRTYSADMWAMGVSLYKLTHDDLDPPFLRGTCSADAVFAKVKSLQKHQVLHQGTSPLDKLIMGLLTVKTSRRLTSTQALTMAISWAKAEGVRSSEIQDIVDVKLAGKRDELPAAWKKCIQKDCYSKGVHCIALGASKVGCSYPCHVSRSGVGKGCATCEKPAFRRAENHCASCARGLYLYGTTCKEYEVGQYVEYRSGGRWKVGIVNSVSDGVVKVKGQDNILAKVYDEIKPKWMGLA